MLLASKSPPPCMLSQRERRAQTVQRTLYVLRAPLGASLSLSAMELSQPRSFSHARAQHTVLYLGAWPGAALARASGVTGDDVAWLAINFSLHPTQPGGKFPYNTGNQEPTYGSFHFFSTG